MTLIDLNSKGGATSESFGGNKKIPHKLLTDYLSIKKWLDDFHLTEYEIVPDIEYQFVVNVGRDVMLDNLELTEIPIKFNHVEGSFYITHNRLTSLYGSPLTVGGNFCCDNNNLSSLEYGPEKVNDLYSCYDNILTSLNGSPASVLSFDCSQNKLSSLEGGPQEVLNYYYAKNNLLMRLKGSPPAVGGGFFD